MLCQMGQENFSCDAEFSAQFVRSSSASGLHNARLSVSLPRPSVCVSACDCSRSRLALVRAHSRTLDGIWSKIREISQAHFVWCKQAKTILLSPLAIASLLRFVTTWRNSLALFDITYQLSLTLFIELGLAHNYSLVFFVRLQSILITKRETYSNLNLHTCLFFRTITKPNKTYHKRTH